MTELLTAAQMRAIERAAIETGEVSGLELMERAGRGVVEAIFAQWPELAETGQGGAAPAGGAAPPPAEPESPRDISGKRKRAVVLCGPGNNGGDGFVVARLLCARGWGVEVYLYGDAGQLPPDAKTNYERWCEMGEVAPLVDERFDGAFEEGAKDSLVVDALFGTGLVRPFLDCRYLAMALNRAQAHAASCHGYPKVVAVDLPSGMCADSGKWLGDDQPVDFAGLANLTISFHREKLGHHLQDGPKSCGNVIVVDIGLDDGEGPLGGRHGWGAAMPPDEIVRLVERPNALVSKLGAHKYSHGHALILSGSSGKTGAARLAARGALRIGAGLVTLGVPHEAEAEVAAQITAVMMRELGDAEALRLTLQDARFNAVCLGPGLGVERAQDLVPVAVRAEQAPFVVLDADAMTAFAEAPAALFEMLHQGCVLTPHEGEFRRLFPDIHARLAAPALRGPAYSKVDATRAAAELAGCTVLFKGPDTVIAEPSGRCAIHSAQYERAAPWLATAGSGDVLAGFITGLLARGLTPMQAAQTGAWLHVECARRFGPGLIAEDLPETLPAVLGELNA